MPLPPVLSRHGRGSHLTLLYQPATVRVDDYESDAAPGTYSHGLGRARLSIREQPLLTVLFTRLSSLGGADRYAEARWLTGYGDTYDGEPQRVVLAGDLNTVGVHDPEPAWHRIPANLRSRHCRLTAGGEFGDTDRRAIQLLTTAGFHDPVRQLRPAATPDRGLLEPGRGGRSPLRLHPGQLAPGGPHRRSVERRVIPRPERHGHPHGERGVAPRRPDGRRASWAARQPADPLGLSRAVNDERSSSR
ncbi:hypothetical protein GCM10010245_86750 [Streptomyces spectabilis]|uniref:Endonuclease/exonuclease/phosphatase domain-containing protein n=1 Tax=Streptomyces spectabilis TaxID=68270 RepID=A0A7W8B6R9_STRST|nr:hypothetical protein [Streptomyces spectabilis]GGV54800.1 hypothetical protein GCM10010245_86750 [Streptomyces spectabilis]